MLADRVLTNFRLIPMRVRTSIFLVSFLLLAIVLISGYTIRIVIAQQKLSADEIEYFRNHTLALLASRIEQGISTRIRTDIAELQQALRTSPDVESLPIELRNKPDIEEVLLITPNNAIRARWTTRPKIEDPSLERWLIERIKLTENPSFISDSHLHVFIEKIHGNFGLFAVAPNPGSGDASRMIVHFNLTQLLETIAKPLLAEFSKSLKGEIELVDPETWDKDEDESEPYVAWPVGHVLNGWMLSLTPSPPDSSRLLSAEGTSIIGITSAVILALAMATFSVWRELRREQALADLRNRFVANVTHELKTPLALIRVYAETLYLGRIREPERQHQYHHTILREAERLSEMIARVLDFSKANHGELVYSLNETDLRSTVDTFLLAYKVKIQEAGLRWKTNIDNDIPPVAHNRHGIIQILINLVDNAIKYGNSGGMIVIGLQRQADAVRLSVTDFGPGISKDEQDRVLRPFERGNHADPTTGTGLGLALVTQIVKAHGAELRLRHSVGRKGLTVSVLFPRLKNQSYSIPT